MVVKILVVTIALLTAAHGLMRAQTVAQGDEVRVAKYDDGMTSGIYAYVRSFGGIIDRIDDDGITFSQRDPAVVWACISGSLVVVYLYDSGLVGQDNAVRIRYRFDDQAVSPTQSWEKLPVPKAQMEMLATMLAGADPAEIESNPMFQAMMAAGSLGAWMPADSVESFLTAANSAEQVTFQVTDPLDGETFTDVFSLTGFSKALETLRGSCTSR